MTPEERQALEAEASALTRKASVRRDQPGFAANCADLDARIAEIEAVLAEPDEPAE